MNKYESMIIVRSSAGNEIDSILEKIKSIVEVHNEAITDVKKIHKKKLAYEIKHESEGIYINLEFTSKDGAVVSELERMFRISESILKFLTIKKKD